MFSLLLTSILLHYPNLSYAQITVNNGSYFNASSFKQYRNQIINCNDNSDCHIMCSGRESCYGAQIYCPTGDYACNVSCTGDVSCLFTNIDWIPGNMNTLSCGSRDCHYTPYPPPINDTMPMTVYGEDGTIIKCPSKADCHIICDKCWASVIICPSANICNVECSDCGYATILWPSDPSYAYLSGGGNLIALPIIRETPDYIINETATFNCTLEESCKSLTINCPNNKDCNILCGYKACAGSVINCPYNGVCTIICNESQSCRYSILNGPIGYNSRFYIHCQGGSACYHTTTYATNTSYLYMQMGPVPDGFGQTIYFPPRHQNGSKKAFIYAVDNGFSGNYGYEPQAFYALNGWLDIDIQVSDSFSFSKHAGSMHCGYNYVYSCPFEENGWRCDASTTICDDIIYETPLPTKQPSISPTSITSSPTLQPSSNPSSIPTTITANPTFQPSSSPTLSISAILQIKYLQDVQELTELYQIILISFASFAGFTWISANIDGKFIRINHFFRPMAISTFFLQCMDMLSDCFFVAQIAIGCQYFESETSYTVIFYLSIIFIVIPTLIALFQLYFYAKKHWIHNSHAKTWINKYSTILLLLSMIGGGSFAATALLNSYIFRIEFFDMGLTQKELQGFNRKRIYSIVLFENLPQLILQSYFTIWSLKGEINAITISSIIFSLISITVSILSMAIQKSIDFTSSYELITMNVVYQEKSKQHKTIWRSLRKEIGMLLSVDTNMIEMIKPIDIKKGLMIKFYVYIDENYVDGNSFKKLNDANNNGNLAMLFKKAWKLSSAPMITNIYTSFVESKQLRLNSIEMLETQISVGSTSTIQNTDDKTIQ